MANPVIPLALAVTGTGAQTRSAIQCPSTISPVVPVDIYLRASMTGTSGAVSATVTIEISQNDSAWTTAATIGISGTVPAAIFQSLMLNVQAPYIRANVTAITGTGAAVTVLAELGERVQ